MFVVNPDPFLLPAYRLCPFKTDYIALNAALPNDDFAVDYLDKRFGKGNWKYTYNGREAIKFALETYNLEPTDLVTIITTSQNFYISSCVTKTIERFCRWNRELLPETKLVLVNHEFGFVHLQMEALAATGLPIIEDCCTTFFSQDHQNKIGRYGDFSMYSFTKFFPIQIGGILVSNGGVQNTGKSVLGSAETQYIQNVVSNELKKEKAELKKRNRNYHYLLKSMSSLGFTERFDNTPLIGPYVLVLNNNGIISDLNAFKLFLIENGIQSSVFYGEDAFFIPCHQNLSFADIDFITYLIAHFTEKTTTI